MTRLISARCPSCGADIRLPDDRDRGYCSFCGGQVILSKDVTHIHVGTGSLENHLELGERAYHVFDYEGAIDHLEKAQEIDLRNEEVNGLLTRAYIGHANGLLSRARELRSAASQQMAASASAGHVHMGMHDMDLRTRQMLRRQARGQEAYLSAQGQRLTSEARQLEREAGMCHMRAGICPQCGGRTYCANCSGRGVCPDCQGSGSRFLIMSCDECRGSKACRV